MEAVRRQGLLRRIGLAVLPVAALAVFVLWVHHASGVPVFRSQVAVAPGWEQFRDAYKVDSFGADGYFTRAVRSGYNLFYFTPQYGARFTRKTARDTVHSCSGCHTLEQLAYSFVNSDRFDARLGRRVSFEESIMRCYAGPMEGFVPTLFDPAIRDIRLLARSAANHLQLSEGALKEPH
jgi:hypothetical protein